MNIFLFLQNFNDIFCISLIQIISSIIVSLCQLGFGCLDLRYYVEKIYRSRALYVEV